MLNAMEREMCRRRDFIANKCIKYEKAIQTATATIAAANARTATTTPLTANGATTTVVLSNSATEPLTDMQRNHLLKMPTTTATTTANKTLELPTTATTTTTTQSLGRTLRTLAHNWPQSGLLLTLCLSLSLVCSSQAGFACLSNPCVFGVCIDGLNSSYSCYCIDGYTGIQCQTNWDECWSGPCQNGGTCVDGVAYYNCTCPEGFSGSNCEENVDECMSNPCQNGGLCRDRNNGYTCTCQPGYLGDHCELDVAVCDTGTGARCQHGGECIEGRGLEFSCQCSAGWHGRICQEEINECASSPCQNGGVCVDKLAAYACACPMGYTGVNCEEEILICADNPCQNNALCLMEENVPTCYCVPDYHGEKCEFQYDECQLGPRCMNGGVCIDGVDTFSCSCPPLLTGMLCECLMVGEESLDCNYTAPATAAPPVVSVTPSVPPFSTLAPPTVRPVTPPETTMAPSAHPTAPPASAVTTMTPIELPSSSASSSSEETLVEFRVTVAPPESDSHSLDKVPTTIRPQPQPEVPEPTAEAQPLPEPTTPPVGGVSSASTSSSEETHGIYTTLPPMPAPGVTASSSAETSSELITSEEYTTVRRFDVSGSGSGSGAGSGSGSSEEPTTTMRTTVTQPPSITIAVDYASSSSSESVEQPIAATTPSSIYVHRVTTFETSISVDYAPTPTPYFPPETTMSPTKTPLEETTRHLWTELPTTAAPFFTDYPAEVLITTHRTSAGRFTTVQPPVQQETTTAPLDYEPPSVELTTAQTPHIVVTILESNATLPTTTLLPPITTQREPQPQTTHTATETPAEWESSTTQVPPAVTVPAPVEITTSQTMTTEDLVGPPAPPLMTVESPRETTTPRTGVTPAPTPLPTEPPTVASLPAVTVPPTPPSTQSAQTMPPPTPPIYVYSTPGQPEVAAPTKSQVTESSEDTDGANTVASGGAGSGAGGSEGKSGDVDCIKLGCYNGGTCVTTSEGSRVSKPYQISLFVSPLLCLFFAALSKPTTPSFRGNSYLILPPPRIPMKDKRRGPSLYARPPREAVQISLNFSTIEPDGLLLWSEHNQLKFLGLGLKNGHLKLASNLLGSINDTVQAAASGFIADGAWHATSVLLDRTRLELQLDGSVIFTERLPELNRRLTSTSTTTSLQRRGAKDPTISYEDIFYLGGFPNQESVSKRTQGRFYEPFKGCLQDIQFGAEPTAIISDFSAYQGENIGSCDLHGDEPIVV
ncbi:PREDICTED: protein eyes shut [Drosophila arizonae]|uniref:Protein eyes shut n=1 Tax=Drosophila arizonae TaxID=7263 RepID=A0ABM1NNZ5_DROAR|nr:PREDICTED: protein eyes shut [Drosophila arizonae]